MPIDLVLGQTTHYNPNPSRTGGLSAGITLDGAVVPVPFRGGRRRPLAPTIVIGGHSIEETVLQVAGTVFLSTKKDLPETEDDSKRFNGGSSV